jgi:hypothetical protein
MGEKMFCPKCGSKNRAEVNFCEDCGEQFAENAEVLGKRAKPLESLDLLTWSPFRFLFKRKFGALSIDNDHLTYEVRAEFRSRFLTIIFKILCGGFNPLSPFWNSGHSQLKNLSTASLLTFEWVIWEANFMLIFSSGFLALYPVPKSHKQTTKSFIDALKYASVDAKYKVVS